MRVTHGFHATITARPGQGAELIELLLSAVKDGPLAANKDCLVYLVGRSAGNPDVVHVTEGWTTKEAHARNFESPASKAFTARVGALVADGGQYTDEVPVGGRLRIQGG